MTWLNNPDNLLIISSIVFFDIPTNCFCNCLEEFKNCAWDRLKVIWGTYEFKSSIEGEKRKDKEPEKLEENLINKREIGKFSFKIPIEAKKYIIKNKPPVIKKLNGIFILSFELEEAIKTGQYRQAENEEV